MFYFDFIFLQMYKKIDVSIHDVVKFVSTHIIIKSIIKIFIYEIILDILVIKVMH